MTRGTEGVAQSIRVRRVRHSKALGIDPNLIRKLTGFLGPVLEAARAGQTLSGHWPPGGPWRSP
jgi:hypothetical protein